MKSIVLIILMLTIAGCSISTMTNEEVVRQKKICDDAGMDTDVVQNGFTYAVTRVVCIPKRK